MIICRVLEDKKLIIPQWLVTAEVFYVLTMLVLKISLALFFLRIMVKRWQQKVVYVAITFSTLMSIGYFFFACFQCGVSFAIPTYYVSHKLTLSSIRGLTPGSSSFAKSATSVLRPSRSLLSAIHMQVLQHRQICCSPLFRCSC